MLEYENEFLEIKKRKKKCIRRRHDKKLWVEQWNYPKFKKACVKLEMQLKYKHISDNKRKQKH